MSYAVISHLYSQKFGRPAYIVIGGIPVVNINQAAHFETVSEARGEITSSKDRIISISDTDHIISGDLLHGYAYGAINSRDLRP